MPCAGTEGGGPAAIEVTIEGQNFLGYPSYCVVCPDHTLYFDVCWPPTLECFDPYFELCGVGNTLSAIFNADETEICAGDYVQYIDESVGNVTSWAWIFEGGDPATSNEKDPLVRYVDAGEWNTQLTVSDGTNNSTTAIEDFVTAMPLPDVTLPTFDDACYNWPAFELTGGDPAGGTYSGTGVDDGWFDPAVAGLGTHTITYTYEDQYNCQDIAVQDLFVDACAGIDDPENGGIKIYPNPTNGVLNLIIDQSGPLTITISNLLGEMVYNNETVNHNNSVIKIDLSQFENGLYFVTVQTRENRVVRKIKLIK